jgi:carboxypeptidase C (cathepsin A)
MQNDCVARLENLLATGFPVLYYNGQNDIIVCTICTESWLDKVNYSWNKNNEFYNEYFKTWNTTTVAGYYKFKDNLNFATVNKAGHLVPMD